MDDKRTVPSFQKILVFSRKSVTNFGDPILADCCKYLLERVSKEEGISACVSIGDVYEENTEILTEMIIGCDKIVFPGGGLNSVRFNKVVKKIIAIAEQADNKSVYFNAIGLDRYEPDSPNVVLLKEIFSNPIVMGITTRGDFDALKQIVVTPGRYEPEWVFDPAVWTSEAYGVSKSESNVIGVGLIRAEIFAENGIDFPRDAVVKMYAGIINELEKRGYCWKFFTNGMQRDYTFGVKLLEKFKRDSIVFLPHNTPTKVALVEAISNFKAVVAPRMHANIIAGSLGVPSIGLVWNEKLNFFGKLMGCPDRYINRDSLFDSKLIIDKLEEAVAMGYDIGIIEETKEKTIQTIKNIVVSGIFPCWHCDCRN
jgi:hypothetical protein